MIKFFVMDVDGTLTDGKINMSESGELFKSFNIKDGYGIKDILPELKIRPIVITGRESKILSQRCKELGIEIVLQGVRDKVNALEEALKTFSEKDGNAYAFSDVAYCGDDLNDLPCMLAVKKGGGAVFCPQDAVSKVKAVADYISDKNAGDGAVRDIIDHLEGENDKSGTLKSRVDFAVNHIKGLDLKNLAIGIYEVNDFLRLNVSEYKTKDFSFFMFESHKKHIDVQWIITGKEKICVANAYALKNESEYDEMKDVIFWENPKNYSEYFLTEGSYAVFYPENAHKPSLKDVESGYVKKIVAKVKI